jgi:ribonuclease VapC
MVIDASALLAILLNEPERRDFHERIEAAERRLVSAATVVEVGIVLIGRRQSTAEPLFDEYLQRAGLEIVPVDTEQARLARDAFRRFGKGRHAAGLNFGDCFAYALAAVTGEPLLYKGDDFDQTDVAAAR